MCQIELEPCEVWIETERRARKAHRCSCCAGGIPSGALYTVHFSVQDGEAVPEQLCGACADARGAFARAHGEVVPTPSYFPTLLWECIAEGDPESETRWRPMLDAIRARAAA